MTNDSENFPGLGAALSTIANAALSHKEIMGPPELYANVYHDLSSAYMRGIELSGRPMLPSDIYALQVIEGLATHIIQPVAASLLTAGRSAATGAGMLLAAQDAAERQAKADAEAAEREKAGAWDDDTPKAGTPVSADPGEPAAPAKPEGVNAGPIPERMGYTNDPGPVPAKPE